MGRKKKESVEWGGMPQGKELEDIKNAIQAAIPSITTIEEEKAQLNDIFEEINSKTGIPKRVFKFLLKSQYFGDAQETIKKGDDLKEAWEIYNSRL